MREFAAFRLVSLLLLLVLVVVTLGLIGTVSITYVRTQNEATRALVANVDRDLHKAERNRERATEVAVRLLRLELRRVRLLGLVQTCTVVELQGGTLPRCKGIRAEVERLAEVIEEFRHRLAQGSEAGGGGGGGGTLPGTTTRTTTATRTVTTPTPVPPGCPQPNNPNCG